MFSRSVLQTIERGVSIMWEFSFTHVADRNLSVSDVLTNVNTQFGKGWYPGSVYCGRSETHLMMSAHILI